MRTKENVCLRILTMYLETPACKDSKGNATRWSYHLHWKTLRKNEDAPKAGALTATSNNDILALSLLH